ncbi:MAG: hypothetical protein EOP83_27260 [Verrucomicrobiaceae bacterium]|nr:MAG: hypothetical protein EOP83_27260 [Verrucomicrobiaceae bacterium]
MGKFFRDIFTGRDNKTYEMGRVLWFQSVQAFILITMYSLYKGNDFDPITWGAGVAALIAGGGAAIKLKQESEPNEPQQDYLDAVVAAKEKGQRLTTKKTVVATESATVEDSDCK